MKKVDYTMGEMMKMENFFEDAHNVYAALSDDKTREIYADMVLFSLTGEESFVDRHMKKKLLFYGIDLEAELRRHVEQPKVIFGAGYWGKNIYSICPKEWTCFADNRVSEEEKLNGIPVLSARELKEIYPNAFVVIAVSQYTEEIQKQLLEEGFTMDQIWAFGSELDIAINKMKLAQYFDLSQLSHDKDEVFVDVGGFDGMSSRQFIQWSGNRYRHIYVFEANPILFERCKKNLPEKSCTIFNKGLWDENTKISFYESPHDFEYNVILQDHNCFDEEKENIKDWATCTADVVKLDDILFDERVTFIKMDIEGSEANAIKGAERIIKTYKPKLAISVYHRKDDLWTIPLLLLQFNRDYKFYLRQYSFSWGETVLYAI